MEEQEKIDIREHLIGWIDTLLKGYREKEESEAYLYDAYQDAGKKMFEYSEKCDELEAKIKEIRDKAEVMDYYTLPDVIEDLNKLLGEEGNENE